MYFVKVHIITFLGIRGIGPVADDNTMEAIQLYIAGILSSDETVERLSYNKVNNQISFHTEKAIESLEFIRRLAYE